MLVLAGLNLQSIPLHSAFACPLMPTSAEYLCGSNRCSNNDHITRHCWLIERAPYRGEITASCRASASAGVVTGEVEDGDPGAAR